MSLTLDIWMKVVVVEGGIEMVNRLMAFLLMALLIAAVASVSGIAEADEPDYDNSDAMMELIAQHSADDRVKLSENDKLRVPNDPKEGIEYRLESLNIDVSTGQYTTTQVGTVRFGLPATEAHKTARINSNGGLALYAGDSYNIALDASQDGFAAYVIIRDETASTSYEFDIDLPDDFKMVEDGSGSIQILDEDGNIIGAIATPWAFDANGAPVPTNFKLSRDALIQTVEHGGAAYPVIADPDISFGKGIYLRWNLTDGVDDSVDSAEVWIQAGVAANCVGSLAIMSWLGGPAGVIIGGTYCSASELAAIQAINALEDVDDDLTPVESSLTEDCTLMVRLAYIGLIVTKIEVEDCGSYDDIYYQIQ